MVIYFFGSVGMDGFDRTTGGYLWRRSIRPESRLLHVEVLRPIFLQEPTMLRTYYGVYVSSSLCVGIYMYSISIWICTLIAMSYETF